MDKDCSQEIHALLTIKEVLSILRISRTTLWRRQRSQQIECIRIGSRVLFEVETIVTFLAKHRQLRQEPIEIPRLTNLRAKARA